MQFQGQMFQDVTHETWTFRNDPQSTALPVRELGAFLPGNGVAGRRCTGTGWPAVSRLLLRVPHSPRAALRRGLLARQQHHPDWGVTYAELEPYYTQWDKTFGIAGKRQHQGVIQQREPVRGAAPEEYPSHPIDRVRTTLSAGHDQLASRHSRTPPRIVQGV